MASSPSIHSSQSVAMLGLSCSLKGGYDGNSIVLMLCCGGCCGATSSPAMFTTVSRFVLFVYLCFRICSIVTSRPFLKTAGGIVLGSIAVSAVSAVSADVLPYISVAIKASFLKLGMCNICKNNIAKMFLDF